MLRAAVASGSELGNTAKEYMDGGKLVPDQLVTAMLVERLNSADCAQKGWLLDGFPRTAPQAHALISQGIVPVVAINLIVPDSVLVNRVVGRRMDPKTGEIYHVDFNPPPVGTETIIRNDDTEEKANVRIATFKSHAQAVQDKYADILANVDGNREKKAVFADIRAEINRKLGASDDNDDNNSNSNNDIDATGGNAVVTTTADANGDDKKKKSKGMPIDEFVRRAEAAYERGVLETENVAWSGQAGLDKAVPDTRDIRDAARRPLLATGDALALILFAYIGRSNHGSAAFDFAVFKTAIPFLVGWYTVAPFLGAYTKEATDNFKSATIKLGQAWAPSVTAALGIRTVTLHHQPPTPFIIVSFVATAVVLAAWRISYVKVKGVENGSGRQGNILDGFKMVNTLLRRW